MAGSLKLRVKIVWEDELRQAAAALRLFHDLPEEPEKDAYSRAAHDALAAATVALWGIDDPEACIVMCGAADIRKRAEAAGRDEPGDAPAEVSLPNERQD